MFKRIIDKLQTWLSNWRIANTTRAVAQHSAVNPDAPTVIFFNASARLGHLSQNAAFAILSAWGLRLAGVRVVHFVCNSGMTRCVLGTNPDDLSQPPPCEACVRQSKRLYSGAETRWFSFTQDQVIESSTANLDLAQLEGFVFNGYELGKIILPSLRWALRRHHLNDDESTRYLYRQYILSSYNIAREFETFLDTFNPQSVVVFNGIMFPEAIARQVAKKHGIRVITHEVALLPMSAFFTDGQATAYPMQIPGDFQLNSKDNAKLDEYLSQRFQGKFTMAGIRFWPKMQELDEEFLTKASGFKHIVPIFTNVIFDTSQVHANSVFPNMFTWLDETLKLVRSHPDTLFIIRAHPDELRPGTRKQSRESVAQWARLHDVDNLPNAIFVDSTQYLSSYALIQRAHFVMVYNSSIGLEASIMGKPVLCAGAARYTQYETVFYRETASEYMKLAEKFLISEKVEQPHELITEARRVLYYQLFRTALPFGQYLTPHSRMGYVHVNSFSANTLKPESSPAIRSVHDGVVNDKPFLV